MNDDFIKFIRQMNESENYIESENLKDGYSYKIYARNAYVGIWNQNERGFLISRFKFSLKPYLFYEYHWDNDMAGTVKPLEIIEKCPFENLSNIEDENVILDYLNELEVKNPIIKGFSSLQMRMNAVAQFNERLSKQKLNPEKLKVHEFIKQKRIDESEE